ncbi:MAG: hypothetical protein A2857_03360 [Candidatus Levybacteria bacterium RIFCSPHIGHO2_01_FULL_36_15]|nr:MAG: hypothetical protein A2857_03360 [Candidatus Levybacteria bacterium RIFCSPHIGHO2_01_FULL_36_15]OGH38642.1 MAG: hypothetical protein A2905_06180 [Candidatus Levybacteria bacterium RIFCSPLOWO2_01_FULL_36_10]
MIKPNLSVLKVGIISQFPGYLWKNKLLWTIPIFLFLLLFIFILIFTQGTGLGSFIYRLF